MCMRVCARACACVCMFVGVRVCMHVCACVRVCRRDCVCTHPQLHAAATDSISCNGNWVTSPHAWAAGRVKQCSRQGHTAGVKWRRVTCNEGALQQSHTQPRSPGGPGGTLHMRMAAAAVAGRGGHAARCRQAVHVGVAADAGRGVVGACSAAAAVAGGEHAGRPAVFPLGG